jgi:hypothetical protein
MRVHLYTAGSIEARTLTATPEARLRDLVELADGEQGFVVDDGHDEEDESDGDDGEGADPDATVAALFGTGSGHLVTHTCRRVAITVAYAGGEQIVKVPPSARLRQVRRRAIAAFGIAAADAADLVLRLPGSDQDLDLTLPAGAIVPQRSCEAAVDLVHTVRPQG